MISKTGWLAFLLAGLLAACGGGGSDTGNDNDDDDDNNPPVVTTETGVFVDSAVGGIGYSTETLEGETSAEGEFEYVDGETVTFFLGDIALPAVSGAALITPMDVFDTDDMSNQRVINLARLLQSLDEDGDASNGISITENAHLAATGVSIDFDVPTTTFEANADVINVVSNGGGAGTLVSADDALAHLEQLTLIGSWYPSDLAEFIAATFMPDGTYMIIEGEAADEAGQPGIEYGTYTWDYLTGAISVEVETDTTGEWGLSHPQADLKLFRVGNEVFVTETLDGLPDDATFVKAASADNPLVGGWMLKIPEEEKVIVITFTDTYYAHGEIGPADGAGTSGPEFGTYTWNQVTGAFVPVAEVNLNGEWGFSDEPAAITVAVDGDQLIFTFEGEEGGSVLTRVK